MKISLLSIHSGRSYRGVETFVHHLANHLAAYHHAVTVWQSGPKIPKAVYHTEIISGSPSVAAFTRTVLSRLEADTNVVLPTNGRWQSYLTRIWCSRHGAKMIISGQSGPGLDDRLNLWSFPDAFVSLTAFQDRWTKSVNPFVNRRVIPNGVDLQDFQPQGKALLSPLPRPVILCVAALEENKRLPQAIAAVSRLSRGSLWLVGTGPLQDYLEQLGRKSLPGRFAISSFPHAIMPQVYRAAELFTFPTVAWESFGIVLLEALATGLPVVTSDDPIRREIVGQAGHFVDPDDAAAYATGLTSALAHPHPALSLAQARKFSWSTIAKDYHQLLVSLSH